MIYTIVIGVAGDNYIIKASKFSNSIQFVGVISHVEELKQEIDVFIENDQLRGIQINASWQQVSINKLTNIN